MAAGEPSLRHRKLKDRRMRQRRWRDAEQALFDIEADCQVWLDNLRGATGQHDCRASAGVCELDSARWMGR
jgi:hypothetical protein